MADLDEIMSGRSEAVTEQNTETPAVEKSTEGQARDEQGRFAAQQAAPQTPQAPAAQPEGQQQEQRTAPDGFVPIQALDARLAKERERADAALRQQAEQFQRMMQTFQQQARPAPEAPKPPDFFENPDAAVDYRLNQAMQPVQMGQQAIVENFSRMMAMDKFGEEAVNAAYQDLQTRMQSNPRAVQFDYQRIMTSPHPFGELVKWHKAQSALSRYGDDPDAAINAEVERRLAERAQQAAPAAQQTVDPNSLPTSFNRNSGPASAAPYSGPRPLSELMGR